MKKSIWLIVSIATFFLGIFVTAVFLLKPLPEKIQEPPLLINCESKSFPGKSREIKEVKKGKSGYFPKDNWQSYKTNDDFINDGYGDWYGKFLTAMKQDSLLDTTDDSEIYRFLWLRTFHRPIVVTVKRQNNSVTLSTVETNGAGGYQPREIIRATEFKLKDDEYCNFVSLLDKSDFWNMTKESEARGMDGAQWIMEGVKNGRYHFTERWSPDDGNFREACIYLLRLSGVDVDKLGDELY